MIHSGRAPGGFPDLGPGGTLEVHGSAVAQMFAMRCGARGSCGVHKHRSVHRRCGARRSLCCSSTCGVQDRCGARMFCSTLRQCGARVFYREFTSDFAATLSNRIPRIPKRSVQASLGILRRRPHRRSTNRSIAAALLAAVGAAAPVRAGICRAAHSAKVRLSADLLPPR